MAKKIVSTGVNDLATRNPELAAQWDYDKNDGVTPRDILPGSNKKYWWVCPECGNEWQAVVGSRNSGCGCPKCKGKRISESKRANNARRHGRQMSIDFSAVRRNAANSE